MPELLEVRDLKIQARKDDGSTVPIVKGVSFDVKAGEVVALIRSGYKRQSETFCPNISR